MINCSASGASEAEQFYNSLNFESIAHQSKFYVTDDFILPDCEFCVFSISDDSVIEIIDNTAVVKQKVYKDSKVSLQLYKWVFRRQPIAILIFQKMGKR